MNNNNFPNAQLAALRHKRQAAALLLRKKPLLLQERNKWRLELKDYKQVLDWIAQYVRRKVL
jgi:hypothetical protein